MFQESSTTPEKEPEKVPSTNRSSPESVSVNFDAQLAQLVQTNRESAQNIAEIIQAASVTEKQIESLIQAAIVTEKQTSVTGKQISRFTRYQQNRDRELEQTLTLKLKREMSSEESCITSLTIRKFYYPNGNFAAEWDGIVCDHKNEILYLLEFKQAIRLPEILDIINDRLRLTFKIINSTNETMEIRDRKIDVQQSYGFWRPLGGYSLRPVIGGNNITEEMCADLLHMGFAVLYPFGDNFDLKLPSTPFSIQYTTIVGMSNTPEDTSSCSCQCTIV